MNERGTGVLTQYELEVIKTCRTRGAVLCETDRGLKLLKEWTGSDRRIQLEYEVLSALEEETGLQVDCCIRNREGALVCVDEDHTRYVVRNWYEGKECSTRETGEILRAAELLAKLHLALRRLEEEHILDRRRVEARRENAEAEKSNSDAPEISPGTEEKGEEASPETEKASLEDGADSPEEYGEISPEAFGEVFRRHNRELKRTRTFVKSRRKKTEFELLVIGGFEKFYRQAEEAAELAVSLNTMPKSWWCHGEYSHHHVLLGTGVRAITDFSRMHYGIQVSDLYYFMRKILEKHRFNLRLARQLLDAYTAVLPLTRKEWSYLYILFLYPEKYWKQMNYYVNSNKAWIPARNIDKLKALESQFEARNLFLKELERKAMGILY